MPKLTPKKENDQPVWKDGHPVYVNADTSEEIVVDVEKLYNDVNARGEEAKRNRLAKEAAEKERDEARSGMGEFADLGSASDVKRKLAELKEIKEGGGGTKMREPTDEELDAIVQQRYEASLGDRDATIQRLKEDNEAADGKLKATQAVHRQLYAREIYNKAIDGIENFNPGARDDAIRRLEADYEIEVEEGDDTETKILLVMRDANGQVIRGTDPTKAMVPKEHLTNLVREEKRIWLLLAKGSPHPAGPGDGSGTPDLSNATSEEAFAIGLKTPTLAG